MRVVVAAIFVFAASISAAQESSEAKVAAQDKAAQDKAAAEAKATAEAKAAASPSPEARRGVRPGDVQKVFVLKHVHVNDLARLLSVFPAEISGMERDNTRVLSVSASPAVVAAIEETIKRLDVPPPPIRSVEITTYVLECAPSGEPGILPQELQGVLVQLKKAFNYTGCSLARTLYARGSDDGRVSVESNERGAGIYQLSGRVEVDSSEPPVVRLRSLDLTNVSPNRSRLSGDIEVRDGQKVVLGRLGTTESGKDQIVVLTAKVAP